MIPNNIIYSSQSKYSYPKSALFPIRMKLNSLFISNNNEKIFKRNSSTEDIRPAKTTLNNSVVKFEGEN